MEFSDAENKGERFIFQLFVAGDEHHSRAARQNLSDICKIHIKEGYEIQIVDVFEFPNVALENKIFLTPALVRVSPLPRVTVYGDLSNKNEVLKVQGLETQ